RPDPADRNLDCGIIGGRAQHHGLGREPRARTQQPFQLTARLQILVTSQRHDHLLTHLLARAAARDDLQIGASGRGLAAKVHDASVCWYAHRVAIRPREIQQESSNNVALHFRASAPSAPTKSIAYVTRPRTKCRRW